MLVPAPSSEVEVDAASDIRFNLVPELPGSHYLEMAHGPAVAALPESLLRVQLVGPEEAYCARVHDVQVGSDGQWLWETQDSGKMSCGC